MKEVIIYGASETGKRCYLYLLERDIKVLFFVDSNPKLWNTSIYEKQVYPPDILSSFSDTCVFIASSSEKSVIEISNILYSYGIKNAFEFDCHIKRCIPNKIVKEINLLRTINLGVFLSTDHQIYLKELTFIQGGSGVLDYAFLRALMLKFNLKKYCEIGTYIGESINIVSDLADVCYSITAPVGAEYSTKNWCMRYDIPDYSERLSKSENIIHYYINSHEFDYSTLDKDIDLYFIDGDHSYDGIKNDTENIFKHRKEDSFVVWHDFRDVRDYLTDTVMAIYDILGKEFENVYGINNNLCAIYIPPKYKNQFPLIERKYSDKEDLFVYDTILKIHKK